MLNRVIPDMLNPAIPETKIGDGLGLATQAELDSHSNANTGKHGVGSSYIAKTSRSDQFPAWADIPDKPASFAPSAHKTSHATGGADALTPADIGAETPSGAQAKADAAQAAAATYTDGKVTTRFVAVPATATASGSPGDWSADASFLYVCHAANTWKRVAIATW